VHKPKAALLDEPVDPAIQMTTASQHVLDRIEPILPDGDAFVLAAAVFQKD